ncbi:hypothetical protein J1N35_014395, partial [Gossypium stocksii]
SYTKHIRCQCPRHSLTHNFLINAYVDVCTIGAPSSANQDLIKLPKGPMTRACTKQLQEALTALL